MSQPVKYSELWDRLQPHALKSINGMQNNKKSTKGGQNPYVILLYKASSQVVSPYSVTDEGLQAAAAASADGDGIWLPACSISGAHTLPAGVALVGLGREVSVLTGQLTLGAGAALIDVGVVRSLNDASVYYGMVGPASGTAYIQDCKISVTQAGAGTGYGLRVLGGKLESYGSTIFGTTAGVVWGGVGQWKSYHDRITASVAVSNGQTAGTYTFDSDYQGFQKVASEWDPHPNHVLSIDTTTYHGSPGAIKITSADMGSLDYTYTGPLTLYKDISQVVHTDDEITLWTKLAPGSYRGERIYIKVVYTDNTTLIFDYDQDASHDWTQWTLTVPAGDDGKTIQRVYFGEYLDGWDNVFASTWWFDDLSIVGQVSEYDPNYTVAGSIFENQPGGVPEWGDRSVWDTKLYPDRHTNDADDSATALHHTLGVEGKQAAAGDHQTHEVEDLVNVTSTTPAIGDLLQQTDWLEIPGGAESLYDSSLLVVDGNGDYANAYDGSYANYWRADPPPNWTTAAFPHRVFLSKVIIDQTVTGWPLNDVRSCAIYGSDTGAFGGEETLIVNKTTGFSGIPGRTTITIAAPRTGYRYYKFDFGSTPYNVDITEIELYVAEAKPKWENKTLAGAGIAADDHTHAEFHDAVTVSDTSTVDLTLSGQALSAAVIPAGIKLDDLGAPDDNTDLNASAAKHGLLPKLSNVATQVLSGIGTWISQYFAFNKLTDVPADYTGHGGKFIKVKTTVDGLEFATIAGGGDVLGPATSTDGHLAVWDGTNSKTLTDGGAVPAGGGAVATDAIWDAAGDIVQGTGANTAARLAIGTAGQVLKVNAGATAAEWGTASASASGFYGTQLLRTLVGAGGQANFDVSSIDAGYDIISIFLQGKSESGSGIEQILMTFNNDTTDANYRTGRSWSGSYTGAEVIDTRVAGWMGGSTNDIAQNEITIINYAGAFRKTFNTKTTLRVGDDLYIQHYGGTWESTTAINRITLTTASGSDFAEGTLCVIVGYKNHA